MDIKSQDLWEAGISADVFVEENPLGKVHIIISRRMIFVSQKHHETGNVLIYEKYQGIADDSQLITPDIGNISHSYRPCDTVPINPYFLTGHFEDVRQITGYKSIKDYLEVSRGLPATLRWEQTMLQSGNPGTFPQRIGHRIYNDQYLQAQIRLREAYGNI